MRTAKRALLRMLFTLHPAVVMQNASWLCGLTRESSTVTSQFTMSTFFSGYYECCLAWSARGWKRDYSRKAVRALLPSPHFNRGCSQGEHSQHNKSWIEGKGACRFWKACS